MSFSFGGSSGSGSTAQQAAQAVASSSSGNNAGQYANGPTNAPQLQGALNAGQNLYQNGNALTNAGLNNINAGANSALSLYGQGNNTLNNEINGAYLSAGNPYFQNAINTAANSIVPAVSSQFEANGRYGSGAFNNALASNMAQEAGNLAYQNYNQGLNNQLTATQSLPSYTAGLVAPGQTQLNAGYTPLNQFTQQLATLQPGTLGSFSGTNTNNSNSNGTSSSSGNSTNDISNFGVNAKSSSNK